MNQAEERLDKSCVRRAFDAAASTYDAAAGLQRDVGQGLLDRLDALRPGQPCRVVDLGSGTGMLTTQLCQRYPGAQIIGLDLSTAMLQRTRRAGSREPPLAVVCADAESLPFKSASVDLLFSSLMFQWCQAPRRLFAECRRVLRPDGLLVFSTLGPETLRELRQSWSAADDHAHVNRFSAVPDIRDALAHARFDVVSIDRQPCTRAYTDVRVLMESLKAIGAHSVTAGRARGLTGPRRLRRMLAAYETYRTTDGLLPATWDVIYGQARVLPGCGGQEQVGGGAMTALPDGVLQRAEEQVP